MIRAEKPKIIQAGDSACCHFEKIGADGIGTCQKCGRAKQYNFGAYSEQNFTIDHQKLAEKHLPIFADQKGRYGR